MTIAHLSTTPREDSRLSAPSTAAEVTSETLLDDTVLAQQVRDGDMAAFDELWRRHWPAARAFARRFRDLADVDDLVQEGFINVLDALRGGRGPDTAFRSYLFRTIQNGAISSGRRKQAIPAGDRMDLETMRPGAAQGEDESSRVLERTVAARALETLPERWRAVLWNLVVEDRPLNEVAAEMGLSENATAALAKRAREGFRTAWLTAHTSSRGRPSGCSWCIARLARLERGTLTKKERTAVLDHLSECVSCSGVHAQVTDLAKDLRGVLLPLAALGTTTAAGSGALLIPQTLSATTGAAGATGSVSTGHLMGGIKYLAHQVVSSAGASVAGVATVSVAVVGTVTALVVLGGDDAQPPPAPTSQVEPQTAPTGSAEDVVAPTDPAVDVPVDPTSPASIDQLDLLPEPESTPTGGEVLAESSASSALEPPTSLADGSPPREESAPAVVPAPAPTAETTETPRPITPTDYAVVFPAFTAPKMSTAFSVPVVVSNVGGTAGTGNVVLEVPVGRYFTVSGVSGAGSDVSVDTSDPAVVRISLGSPVDAYGERRLLLDLVYGDPASWAHIAPPNEGCTWARPRASVAASLAAGLPGAGTASGATSLVVPGSAACTAEP